MVCDDAMGVTIRIEPLTCLAALLMAAVVLGALYWHYLHVPKDRHVCC